MRNVHLAKMLRVDAVLIESEFANAAAMLPCVPEGAKRGDAGGTRRDYPFTSAMLAGADRPGGLEESVGKLIANCQSPIAD